LSVVESFQQSRESWQAVFFIAAAVNVFGGIVYNVLGSGVIQPWAIGDDESDGKKPRALDVDVTASPDTTETDENGSARHTSRTQQTAV
jgi:hypothetical protein